VATEAEGRKPEEKGGICPYWHQLGADFTSMYPNGGYCVAGCHEKVKLMAGKTIEEFCLLHHGDCAGYQRLLAAQRAAEPPETPRR